MYTPAVLGWVVLGAMGLPAAEFCLHLLLQIPELYAGQYEIFLLVAAFQGAMLGLFFGGGLALEHSRKHLSAGQTWLYGGIFLAFILLRSGFVPTQWGGPIRTFVLFSGLPFACSLRLMAIGLRKIRRRPKDEG